MKVLLLQQIKKIGRAGEIKDVADGLALNSLIPQKKAVQATAAVIQKHQHEQKIINDREAKEKAATKSKIKAVNGKSIVIQEKLNEKGSLYHALGLKEIIRAIKDQHNVSVPNFLFKEKYSIKNSGEYKLKLNFEGEKGEVALSIEAK